MDKKIMVKRFNEAVAELDEELSKKLLTIPDDIKASTQEIRLRANRPVMLGCGSENFFLTKSGTITAIYREGMLVISKEELQRCISSLCEYSVHTFSSEIANGFITLRGGHRAGLCGTAVQSGGKITSVRDISSVNLRISRQIFGAADRLIEEMQQKEMRGLLLVGAPSCGKTTVLRDLARQLSSGRMGQYMRVAVVDERCEIAGVYRGIPNNELGPCCDCLDGYPKAEGIMHALRSLSPDIIICDELGTLEEISAISEGLNSGVTFIASLHAAGLDDLLKRRQAVDLIHTGAFSHIATMDGRHNPGKIMEIVEVKSLEIDRTSDDCTHRRHAWG